jgi:hypothetical protein
MLIDFIAPLKAKLEDTGLFGEIYLMVELLRTKEKLFPAHYEGAGEYKHLMYDTANGMAYFRKNGQVKINEADGFKMTSCEPGLMRYSVPLKLIAFIPKEKAECDNAFTDDYFSDIIISALTNSTFFPEAIETDGHKVLSGEYAGIDTPDFNYNYSYLCIEFTLEYYVSPECLNPCDNYG